MSAQQTIVSCSSCNGEIDATGVSGKVDCPLCGVEIYVSVPKQPDKPQPPKLPRNPAQKQKIAKVCLAVFLGLVIIRSTWFVISEVKLPAALAGVTGIVVVLLGVVLGVLWLIFPVLVWFKMNQVIKELRKNK